VIPWSMDSQPEDIAALRAELALARAQLADDAATIAHQNRLPPVNAALPRRVHSSSLPRS